MKIRKERTFTAKTKVCSRCGVIVYYRDVRKKFCYECNIMIHAEGVIRRRKEKKLGIKPKFYFRKCLLCRKMFRDKDEVDYCNICRLIPTNV